MNKRKERNEKKKTEEEQRKAARKRAQALCLIEDRKVEVEKRDWSD